MNFVILPVYSTLKCTVLLLRKVGALPRNKHHVCTSLNVTNSVSRDWPQQKNVKIGDLFHILHILMSASWVWSFFFCNMNQKKLQKGHHQSFCKIYSNSSFFFLYFCSCFFFFFQDLPKVSRSKKSLFFSNIGHEIMLFPETF